MKRQRELPTTQQLREISKATLKQQDHFFDSLLISTLEQSQVDQFERRLKRVERSTFIKQLEQTLTLRKTQLNQEIRLKLEQRKLELENRKHQFNKEHQERKHKFNVSLQTVKSKIEYGAKVLILIGYIITIFGICVFISSPPQFSVPAGGSVHQGQINWTLYWFGIGISSALGVILIIALCFCCCKQKQIQT